MGHLLPLALRLRVGGRRRGTRALPHLFVFFSIFRVQERFFVYFLFFKKGPEDERPSAMSVFPA